MGAQSSTAGITAEQRYVNEMIQKCGTTSCKNRIGDVDVQVTGSGTVSGLNIIQDCQVDANCVYNAMAEDVSKLRADAAAEAAAGLGISASDVKIQTAQEIRKKQEQDCGVTETDNIIESIKVGASDTGTLENMNISQLGNAKQVCMFEALSKSYMESASEAKAKTTGYDPMSMIFLIIGGIALVIFIWVMFSTSLGGSLFKLVTFQMQSKVPSVIFWLVVLGGIVTSYFLFKK